MESGGALPPVEPDCGGQAGSILLRFPAVLWGLARPSVPGIKFENLPRNKIMSEFTGQDVKGDVVFPEQWTVFAPLKRSDPVLPPEITSMAVRAEMFVGSTTVT